MGLRSKANLGSRQTDIEADVIILGCSLPGLVVAHKLRRRFGNAMNIVVLNLATPRRTESKGNVTFIEFDDDEEDNYEKFEFTALNVVDNIAKYFLTQFAKDCGIHLPEPIINPKNMQTGLKKLFQFRNGQALTCTEDYYNFDYLNILERFELKQYRDQLDDEARHIFRANRFSSEIDQRNLLYYDRTSMEQHICGSLLFSTSREIMRLAVRLMCGTPAHSVSVLFYLHQCHRSYSSTNHLDGKNTRLREKLLGSCRKQAMNKMRQSTSDITYIAKSIQKIRSNSEEQVILETITGDPNYICNSLAMAVRPEELLEIAIEEELLSHEMAEMFGAMSKGQVKKFIVQYEEKFWRRDGYSGDIFSILGPVIWAMERPKLTNTGGVEKYAGLVGYMIARDDAEDSQDAVLEQLTQLIGEEAANPVIYKESDISDIYVPRCGDYVAIQNLMTILGDKRKVEWGAMDLFADGDMVSAIEAGHNAYLHLVTSLRPQAPSYEEMTMSELPTVLGSTLMMRRFHNLNYISSMYIAVTAVVAYVGFRLFREFAKD